ncbi:CDGSH iron-sulfur domain-containing protein [Aquitalea magnusonii]|uniref:CDGSH-type Zn-finger protein n=1 Tax=Aquitalea magnusonii TaxID=332411 RepID=A0A318JLF1_9NEIS|nr:CDGSH iron-sulfur domain-containing protein [Aquitalea magnusonii]PXX50563.1 CDGSH-type Zn-finger protein [Aquitalea magnusonii]
MKALKITVMVDGPYRVSGASQITQLFIQPDAQGVSWSYRKGKSFPLKEEGSALCRCGHSANKPYCDGSHQRIGFDGRVAATRAEYAQQAELQEGPVVALSDAEKLCAFARFCDAGGQIWHLVEQADAESIALAVREAEHCPAGRLKVWDMQSQQPISKEPDTPSLYLLEDPQLGCSAAIWVKAADVLEVEQGKPYPVRERMTLCRCGASSNKPFCDGTHASIKWQDGL